MGRWSTTTLLGSQNQKLTVISAYQVYKAPFNQIQNQSSQKKKLLAAITQQQAMMDMLDPGSSMHPRTKFRLDLLKLVQDLKQESHEIILMGDFNEEYGSDSTGLSHIASTCSLVDVLHQRLGSSNFATYARGSTRIDYVLMSRKPAEAILKCGYEAPNHRFQGDHRVFFADFRTDKLFGTTTPSSPPQQQEI
jgi:exonuclease III